MKAEISTKSLNYLYKISLLLRLLFVFIGVSYIHPDQFFQSTEVVAGDVFGFEVERTWEFDKDNACRTIFTPSIIAGIPYIILKTINLVNSLTLFYFPRIFLFAASFIVDWIVWDLSGNEMSALTTFGSSWVTIVFLLCPFSNTTETLLLAILLYLSLDRKDFSWGHYLLIGTVLAVGLFNRFTFMIFSFPVGLYLLYNELLVEKNVKKGGLKALISGVGSGFFIMATIITIIDSIYFGSIILSFEGKPFRWLDLFDYRFYLSFVSNLLSMSIDSFSWTATPINSIIYNSNEDNLAEHGRHWRLTHSIANMPILLGPLYVVALLPHYNWLDGKLGEKLGFQAAKRVKGKKTLPQTKLKRAQLNRPKKAIRDLVNIGVIASGIIVLSFAPHQEMRFLVPLLVPFVLLGHKGILGSNSNRLLHIIWFMFNILLLMVMGIAHQGGMIPSILSISQVPTQNELGEPITNHLIYYHTYMPPRHLLTIEKQSRSKPKFAVYDLKGSPITDLKKKVLRIKESLSFSNDDEIFIIAPTTTDLNSIEDMILSRKFWPHLSFENLPNSLEELRTNLTLSVYKLTNKT